MCPTCRATSFREWGSLRRLVGALEQVRSRSAADDRDVCKPRAPGFTGVVGFGGTLALRRRRRAPAARARSGPLLASGGERPELSGTAPKPRSRPLRLCDPLVGRWCWGTEPGGLRKVQRPTCDASMRHGSVSRSVGQSSKTRRRASLETDFRPPTRWSVRRLGHR